MGQAGHGLLVQPVWLPVGAERVGHASRTVSVAGVPLTQVVAMSERLTVTERLAARAESNTLWLFGLSHEDLRLGADCEASS